MSATLEIRRVPESVLAELELRRDPVATFDLFWSDHPGLSLDEWWLPIHFTLTGGIEGNSTPLGFLLERGVALGRGAPVFARGLRLDEVRKVSAALAEFSDELFGEHWPDAMAAANDFLGHTLDLYVEEVTVLEHALHKFHQLRDFIVEASASDEALVIGIS